ncbi:MAG TPA: GNAT family N-acetyltransferase [Nocardioides sp.]|jgi:ribosomal protein S18 acetylase RimI-like enzyme|nr:GNAT family N-acetyltransferase [Nocardioides sp.]
MEVRRAETDADLDAVRRLFHSFLAWHRQRHVEDLHLIDAYFDDEAYEREIKGLPGEYAPPDGDLLVCHHGGLAVGCGAFRRLDGHSCEMKRMYVAPTARRGGGGRALATELVVRARARGYRRMYLDTSIRQVEAIALYRDLGFEEVEPYYDVPEAMLGWLSFFGRDL